MPTLTENYINDLKINKPTRTQLNNATTLSSDELYLENPEFVGGKLLATDANGDIVESTIEPTSIGTVKDVEVNGTSVVSDGVASIDLTGYEEKGTITTLSSTASITLSDQTYYKGGTQTSLTVTVPSSGMDVNFISQITFVSGNVPTTLSFPQTNFVWNPRGDDITEGVFLPVANKAYTIIICYNGVQFTGITEGLDYVS